MSKERGNVYFRWIDRYIGIFLLFFLQLFRKKDGKQEIQSLESIAFIKLGAIGDSILTFPIIFALKEQNPDVKITIICGKNNCAVYENLVQQNLINEVIYFDFNRLLRDWSYGYRKIKEIRTDSYDCCIDFDSWYRISALVSFLIIADYKMGFKTDNEFKHYLFDYHEEHKNTCHEFENYKNLAKPLTGDISGWPTYPALPTNSDFFYDFIHRHQIENFIVLHPWASGFKNTRKELDMNALVYLGNKMASDNLSIIITGGKEDVSQSEKLSSLIDNSISVAGKTSLNQTAVFLKKADCVVTVNTGILHLAAAMGSRIVSINGPTDINRWGPLSEKATNITSSLFCSPCLNLGFEYKCKQNGVPAGHCMSKIDLDGVVNAALGKPVTATGSGKSD